MKFSCIFLVTFWWTIYISEKGTAIRDEEFVIQPDDEGVNAIIEENYETDNYDMQRKDKKTISGDENFGIQPADEGSNNIKEEIHKTASSDMKRNAKKPFSTDENVVIQSADEGFNVTLEKRSETVSPDMQRKGKNKTPSYARNCLELKQQRKGSGTYSIKPCDDTNKVVKVYCDMDTDDGGWTVIQRRNNYPQQQDFYGNWNEYAIGFGNVSKDFWLGNDNIHCLTVQTQNEIRFDLEDWSGNTSYAKYRFFYIADQTKYYRLDVQNYTGTAGDSLAYHNNRYFSTYDSDHDSYSGNCPVLNRGAWWYGICSHSNLNGEYNATSSSCKGVWWTHWRSCTSLKKTEMKIRPRY